MDTLFYAAQRAAAQGKEFTASVVNHTTCGDARTPTPASPGWLTLTVQSCTFTATGLSTSGAPAPAAAPAAAAQQCHGPAVLLRVQLQRERGASAGGSACLTSNTLPGHAPHLHHHHHHHHHNQQSQRGPHLQHPHPHLQPAALALPRYSHASHQLPGIILGSVDRDRSTDLGMGLLLPEPRCSSPATQQLAGPWPPHSPAAGGVPRSPAPPPASVPAAASSGLRPPGLPWWPRWARAAAGRPDIAQQVPEGQKQSGATGSRRTERGAGAGAGAGADAGPSAATRRGQATQPPRPLMVVAESSSAPDSGGGSAGPAAAADGGCCGERWERPTHGNRSAAAARVWLPAAGHGTDAAAHARGTREAAAADTAFWGDLLDGSPCLVTVLKGQLLFKHGAGAGGGGGSGGVAGAVVGGSGAGGLHVAYQSAASRDFYGDVRGSAAGLALLRLLLSGSGAAGPGQPPPPAVASLDELLLQLRSGRCRLGFTADGAIQQLLPVSIHLYLSSVRSAGAQAYTAVLPVPACSADVSAAHSTAAIIASSAAIAGVDGSWGSSALGSQRPPPALTRRSTGAAALASPGSNPSPHNHRHHPHQECRSSHRHGDLLLGYPGALPGTGSSGRGIFLDTGGTLGTDDGDGCCWQDEGPDESAVAHARGSIAPDEFDRMLLDALVGPSSERITQAHLALSTGFPHPAQVAQRRHQPSEPEAASGTGMVAACKGAGNDSPNAAVGHRAQAAGPSLAGPSGPSRLLAVLSSAAAPDSACGPAHGHGTHQAAAGAVCWPRDAGLCPGSPSTPSAHGAAAPLPRATAGTHTSVDDGSHGSTGGGRRAAGCELPVDEARSPDAAVYGGRGPASASASTAASTQADLAARLRTLSTPSCGGGGSAKWAKAACTSTGGGGGGSGGSGSDAGDAVAMPPPPLPLPVPPTCAVPAATTLALTAPGSHQQASLKGPAVTPPPPPPQETTCNLAAAAAPRDLLLAPAGMTLQRLLGAAAAAATSRKRDATPRRAASSASLLMSRPPLQQPAGGASRLGLHLHRSGAAPAARRQEAPPQPSAAPLQPVAAACRTAAAADTLGGGATADATTPLLPGAGLATGGMRVVTALELVLGPTEAVLRGLPALGSPSSSPSACDKTRPQHNAQGAALSADGAAAAAASAATAAAACDNSQVHCVHGGSSLRAQMPGSPVRRSPGGSTGPTQQARAGPAAAMLSHSRRALALPSPLSTSSRDALGSTPSSLQQPAPGATEREQHWQQDPAQARVQAGAACNEESRSGASAGRLEDLLTGAAVAAAAAGRASLPQAQHRFVAIADGLLCADEPSSGACDHGGAAHSAPTAITPRQRVCADAAAASPADGDDDAAPVCDRPCYGVSGAGGTTDDRIEGFLNDSFPEAGSDDHDLDLCDSSLADTSNACVWPMPGACAAMATGSTAMCMGSPLPRQLSCTSPANTPNFSEASLGAWGHGGGPAAFTEGMGSPGLPLGAGPASFGRGSFHSVTTAPPANGSTAVGAGTGADLLINGGAIAISVPHPVAVPHRGWSAIHAMVMGGASAAAVAPIATSISLVQAEPVAAAPRGGCSLQLPAATASLCSSAGAAAFASTEFGGDTPRQLAEPLRHASSNTLEDETTTADGVDPAPAFASIAESLGPGAGVVAPGEVQQVFSKLQEPSAALACGSAVLVDSTARSTSGWAAPGALSARQPLSQQQQQQQPRTDASPEAASTGPPQALWRVGSCRHSVAGGVVASDGGGIAGGSELWTATVPEAPTATHRTPQPPPSAAAGLCDQEARRHQTRADAEGGMLQQPLAAAPPLTPRRQRGISTPGMAFGGETHAAQPAASLAFKQPSLQLQPHLQPQPARRRHTGRSSTSDRLRQLLSSMSDLQAAGAAGPVATPAQGPNPRCSRPEQAGFARRPRLSMPSSITRHASAHLAYVSAVDAAAPANGADGVAAPAALACQARTASSGSGFAQHTSAAASVDRIAAAPMPAMALPAAAANTSGAAAPAAVTSPLMSSPYMATAAALASGASMPPQEGSISEGIFRAGQSLGLGCGSPRLSARVMPKARQAGPCRTNSSNEPAAAHPAGFRTFRTRSLIGITPATSEGGASSGGGAATAAALGRSTGSAIVSCTPSAAMATNLSSSCNTCGLVSGVQRGQRSYRAFRPASGDPGGAGTREGGAAESGLLVTGGGVASGVDSCGDACVGPAAAAACAAAGPAAGGSTVTSASSPGGGGGRVAEGGDSGDEELVLVVTQIDVTEQVEAHQPLLQLLQQEHKVLESIFPRHILEYLTLRGGDTAQAPSRALPTARGSSCAPMPAAAGLDAGCLATGTAASVEKLASLATSHTCVTILFTDIVGFTDMCSAATPYEVMCFLNSLYSRFDGLVDIYKVYKVETIGDCYMVAGGLVAYDQDGYKSVIAGEEDPLHAVRVMEFAKAMLRAAREVRMPHNGEPVRLRVGLHSGPVTSGVVGDRMPRFCLFGDTVNVASRMESTCRPGRIHVSAATQARLPNEPWRDLGMTAVKGKGEMRTFEWGGDADEHLDGQQLQRVLGLYL
ncbi:hypothetical protein HYH02_007080 [Chlamydomonas schloesseri]|uniref:Guanylate cyclase domain-containing protein n=1 Tax=Chlamydomonas schloesseri TaxID=2026947 RepID=A0A835WIR8_9CHLO|nr:hypothetical protein HYH02_007080 [Chlamydomonas schloesseri]|eukprot:KAG2448053.1 hypothetical protein HYH02_007080 [Chlamydomonas schloesseri]